MAVQHVRAKRGGDAGNGHPEGGSKARTSVQRGHRESFVLQDLAPLADVLETADRRVDSCRRSPRQFDDEPLGASGPEADDDMKDAGAGHGESVLSGVFTV
jgi:hypothetical protein